jgi:hypothetical protein
MYEVVVVRPGQFLAVVIDLVLHQSSKLPTEEADALRSQ